MKRTGTPSIPATAARCLALWALLSCGAAADEPTGRAASLAHTRIGGGEEAEARARLLRKVRDDVLAETGGRQEPFVYGSLPGRDVYLALAPPPDGAEAYEAAKRLNTVAAYRIVVEHFPDSIYAKLAQAQIDKLADGAKEAYEAAERQNTVAAYRIVVDDFPGSIYAKLAQAEIDKLGKSDVDPEEERRLELGREEYRLVQVGLAAAGHDPGPADGRIGSGTRDAIRRWQGARGEPETGYLDVDGAKALMGLGREHEALLRFTELLGRPFSAEFKTDAEGWTDLHYAALLDLPGVVAALCDAGMDADSRLKSDTSFSDDLIRALAALGYKEEFEHRTAGDETPLMIAAVANARNAAAELVACGADVNARALAVVRGDEFESGTPLSYAAWNNSLEMAKLLIEHGADVNVDFWDGETPLHSAASNNSLEMAKLLIERGANVSALTRYFRDRSLAPLNHAASNNSLEMAKLLIEHGGADVDPIERDASYIYWPPLHEAASNDFLEMAKLLLEHGADVNDQEDSSWGGGSVPLHLTASNNSLEMAKLLLDRGADVDATDDDGYTPLHYAAEHSALDVAKLLLDRGADVDATDDDGYTPLHYAAEHSAPDFVKLLLDRGADVNATDDDGRIPLDIALNRGDSDLQALLYETGEMGRGHEAERRGPPGTKFRDCPQCPELVVVPSGSFMMGSPESEAGRYDDEGPVHEVTIGYRLAVGVKEVTRGEFARFVSETGRSTGDSCHVYEGGEWEEGSGRNWKSPGFDQTGSHPAVCVDWTDAKAYVEWLSGKTEKKYRLLSEAEWEYVARAGTGTARYWGEGESGQCRYANGADSSAGFDWSTGCRDGYARTSPVGRFAPNEYKLHNVLGNVWEWVEDCWYGSYHGAPSDGSAWGSGDGSAWEWESGHCGRRVVRGGSWYLGPRDLRSATRLGNTTGLRLTSLGFRVARTLTP